MHPKIFSRLRLMPSLWIQTSLAVALELGKRRTAPLSVIVYSRQLRVTSGLAVIQA